MINILSGVGFLCSEAATGNRPPETFATRPGPNPGRGVSVHAHVLEAQALHLCAVQRVSTVEHEPRRVHAAGDVLPVGVDELRPLRDQDDRLRLVGGLQHVVHQLYGRRQVGTGRVHRLRVVCADDCPVVAQGVDHVQRRRLPNVVGVGLERQSQHPNSQAVDGAAEALPQRVDRQQPLPVVDVDHGPHSTPSTARPWRSW